MEAAIKFRFLLPAIQSALAALFGGWGLWERSAILSRVFTVDGQTFWETTARFHLWPWPFKFAVVTNTPAFLCWALVGWPLAEKWPKAPEGVLAAPSLVFIAMLWFGIGRSIDIRQASGARVWGTLLAFTLICAAGASVPSTTFYFFWGILVWVVFGYLIVVSTRHRDSPTT